jgi:hypothetical protein
MYAGYMQFRCHVYKGLKHPQILESTGDPGTNPLRIARDASAHFEHTEGELSDH